MTMRALMGASLTVVLLATLLTIPVQGQNLIYESGGELHPDQAVYNVHHYNLDLTIDPGKKRVDGKVTIQAVMVHPSDRVVIDLDPRLKIESIRLDDGNQDRELWFEQQNESKQVSVRLPRTKQPGEKISLVVVYGGEPAESENPPWDGGFVWDETPSGEPWIGVATQTIGAWSWFPNKDHPSDKPDSVTAVFTLPDNLVVASNGVLEETSTPRDGWTQWTWVSRSPISPYNVTLNAAPYKVIDETYESITGEEVDLRFWVLPEYVEDARELLPQLHEQMRYFEELLGPYPFRHEKFGVAHAPYLGMEHQTLIAYGAGFRNDALFHTGSGFDDLLHHELAHEWWGNMVTALDWRDFWIHEGFATYMQALYAEHLGGESQYQRMMNRFRGHIESEKPLAGRTPRTSKEMYESGLGADVYYKGAWILHTFRYLLGDDLFFESLRRFVYPDESMERVTDGSQVRFVSTDDFLELLNELSGLELDDLFDVYLRRPVLPVLKKERTGESLKLTWMVPEGITFNIPVDVEWSGEVHRLEFEENKVEIDLPACADVTIDPDRRILMRVEVQ